MNGSRDLGGVHGTINVFELEQASARPLDRIDSSRTIGCCDRVRGGYSCSCCFSFAYGYRKGGQM